MARTQLDADDRRRSCPTPGRRGRGRAVARRGRRAGGSRGRLVGSSVVARVTSVAVRRAARYTQRTARAWRNCGTDVVGELLAVQRVGRQQHREVHARERAEEAGDAQQRLGDHQVAAADVPARRARGRRSSGSTPSPSPRGWRGTRTGRRTRSGRAPTSVIWMAWEKIVSEADVDALADRRAVGVRASSSVGSSRASSTSAAGVDAASSTTSPPRVELVQRAHQRRDRGSARTSRRAGRRSPSTATYTTPVSVPATCQTSALMNRNVREQQQQRQGPGQHVEQRRRSATTCAARPSRAAPARRSW